MCSQDDGDTLAKIADDGNHRSGIIELDRITGDGPQAVAGQSPGIGVEELVFGVPYHDVINAAFTRPHPRGSRFNAPGRGAWYAGFDVETSQAEIIWHKSLELAEIGWVEWMETTIVYNDYLADFSGVYHDIRGYPAYNDCLDPVSYTESQSLAETLLAEGSSGLVYPSVRHKGGNCIVCFRPALVGNVTIGSRFRFTWTGEDEPVVEQLDDFERPQSKPRDVEF